MLGQAHSEETVSRYEQHAWSIFIPGRCIRTAGTDKSFEWLESAYRQRDAGLPEIKTHPLLNLRHDHRYNQLLREMRLPI
jgi:hypothetical protein